MTSFPDPEAVEAAWRRYREAPGPETRRDVADHYVKLVFQVSHHLAKRSGHDGCQLAGYGCEGLFRAIETYDESRPCSFPTYARRKIRWTIIDKLRHESTLPRMTHERLEAGRETERDRRVMAAAMPSPIQKFDGLTRRSGCVTEAEDLDRAAKRGLMPVDKFIAGRMASGWSLQDIAVQLGVSCACVSKRAQRIRERYREVLARG